LNSSRSSFSISIISSSTWILFTPNWPERRILKSKIDSAFFVVIFVCSSDSSSVDIDSTPLKKTRMCLLNEQILKVLISVDNSHQSLLGLAVQRLSILLVDEDLELVAFFVWTGALDG